MDMSTPRFFYVLPQRHITHQFFHRHPPFTYVTYLYGYHWFIVTSEDHPAFQYHTRYSSPSPSFSTNRHRVPPHPYQPIDEVSVADSLDMPADDPYHTLHRHSFRPSSPTRQHVRGHPYQTIDEVAVVDSLDGSSFQQSQSGLTRKRILTNLQLTNYKEEGGELCVVCQDEFKSQETVAMLHCNHRFHPICINNWLLRKNLCPICKAQAIKV